MYHVSLHDVPTHISTRSGAMRLGSATLIRLRENLVNKPISERCVPVLIDSLINNSLQIIANNYSLVITDKFRLYHNPFFFLGFLPLPQLLSVYSTWFTTFDSR